MSTATPKSATWKQRPEGGGFFAIWLIRTIASRGGRALSRLLLYPITLYFLLMRGPERRASRDYLARVLPRPPGWRHVARHIHTFASTILDRVFLLSGQLERFDIQVTGLEPLHAQLDRARLALVIEPDHARVAALGLPRGVDRGAQVRPQRRVDQAQELPRRLAAAEPRPRSRLRKAST